MMDLRTDGPGDKPRRFKTGTGAVSGITTGIGLLEPDLCTEFGFVGDCLLNFGPRRFCQIGFGTSTEDLLL
jgi:hypothetical protein